MYIITKEKSIRKKNIIGIFDLDNATVSGVTKNFLSTAEKADKISGINILPKSFILTDLQYPSYQKYRKYKKYKKVNNFKIYFSSNLSKYFKNSKNAED